MKNFESVLKSLQWLMALLFVAVAAGCNNGGGSTGDTTAPTVSVTVPVSAATDIATNANITATFNEAMTAASITNTTFSLKQGTTDIPGAVTFVGKTATFNPTANLVVSTIYTATVSTGVKDAAGNAMAANKTWSFTTGTATDTTPPVVNATVPVGAAIDIALNANISATFSENMDASTITATTYTLKQGTTVIAGDVSYVGTTATFNPGSDLAASTVYTATISTGVMDLAGNTMAVAKVWTFTTGTSAVAGVAPVLLGAAGNYAILAKTGVSTIPTSAVTGNVGVSPVARTYLTGWSETYDVTDTYATSVQVAAPFKLYAADQVGGTTAADLGTAVLDMGTAYTDAAGRTATSAATTDVGAGTLTSLTLTPGVYEWGSAVTIPTDLTLTGTATDVWIFKVAGTLDMAAAKSVILSGGALSQNVFWQVSGTVTIGANTHFEGIVLGQTAIIFRNLSSVTGRLLAQTAVTLEATTVIQP